MYISKLKHIIDKHDIYGIHRINGLKVVYVYILLAIVNALFTIPNPYFFFFYLPLTAYAADITTNSIHDKYIFYINTIIGTCIAITLFNMFKPYPLFFYLSVFVTSVLLYFYALNKQRNILPFIPIILSLASYSMLYPEISQNLKMLLANIWLTILAMLIVLGGNLLFPLSYYYRAWLRAFLLNCRDILNIVNRLAEGEKVEFSIRREHLRSMLMFAKMLPLNFPSFTVLRINLLLQDLYFECIYKLTNNSVNLANLQKNIRQLIIAIENEKPCTLVTADEPTLNKIASAWNRLCYV